MRKILDNIFGFTTKIGDLFHYNASNSHNKIENNFYGPVNIIGKPPKVSKHKIISLSPKAKKA